MAKWPRSSGNVQALFVLNCLVVGFSETKVGFRNMREVSNRARIDEHFSLIMCVCVASVNMTLCAVLSGYDHAKIGPGKKWVWRGLGFAFQKWTPCRFCSSCMCSVVLGQYTCFEQGTCLRVCNLFPARYLFQTLRDICFQQSPCFQQDACACFQSDEGGL